MSVKWSRVRDVALGVLAGVVASVGTAAVAVAGFALSYDAIRSVGIAARIRVEWAWLLPVSIDGAMAVATIAAVVLRRITGETARYPWLVVGVGAVISIVCNGLHALAEPGAHLKLNDGLRFAVSAIPAVMLALSVHLLVTLVEAASGSARTASAGDVSPGVVPVEDDAMTDDDASPDPWVYAEPIGDASPANRDDACGDALPVDQLTHQPSLEATRRDVSTEPVGLVHATHQVVTATLPATRHAGGSDASNGRDDDGRSATRRGPKPSRHDRLADVLRLVEEDGMSARAAAQKLGVDVQAAQRFVRKHRANGNQVEVHSA